MVGALSTCSRNRDPQSALDHANQTYQRGDMAAVIAEAERDHSQFGRRSVEWAWQFTILRARGLYRRGMYDRALDLLAAEPTPPKSGDVAVQKLRLEAAIYASLHNFPEAEQRIREAQQLCVTNFPACRNMDETQGKLEMEWGRYTEARAFFLSNLASARARNDKFQEAVALLDLSWSANRQAHFDEALDWADSAREISTAQNFGDLTQTALGDMGWAYYKLGDPEKAEGLFVEAERRAGTLGNQALQVMWLQASSYIYLDEGKSAEAYQSARKSLDLARETNSTNDIINSLTVFAIVTEQAGKLDESKTYADEALARARKVQNGEYVGYLVLIEGRIAAQQHDAAAAEGWFHQVEQSEFTPVFLRWEAERSLASLYEAENHPGPADAEYRAALSTFEAARCDLHQRVDSRLPFLTNAARIYEDYIHFLVASGKTDEALQVADYTRARTLTEGLGRACKPKFAPDPLNAPEIARRAGGTILFYALGQEHSYLWAISPRQVKMFRLAVNQVEIDAAVQNYRKKLEGPPQILDASNDGSELYQMLVAPAHDFLEKESSAKNIFIIPDGALNSLNFETLLPQAHHYWIEDVTIANAPSLRLLPTSEGNQHKLAGKLLVVGNPVSPADSSYPELPNAAAQIEAIKKYFPADRQAVFARQQASPVAYLNNHPEQFSYIHFVAHGTASRMRPLDSAIILSREASSPSTAQDDSFKLYARDIINNHPLHAELVTISACYSTGNRTYSGEGLVGLSWAFLRAGAHNVVAALWDVSDASTPQFVDDFYNELKKGKPPAAALRSAKLSLLHSKSFHGPFYWAPFQLYTGS
jgi:CHAT domain-containing protein